jgi:hypothetical protein
VAAAIKVTFALFPLLSCAINFLHHNKERVNQLLFESDDKDGARFHLSFLDENSIDRSSIRRRDL